MKKIYTILFLGICVVLLQSGIKKVNNSSVPPRGYTGATGNYCSSCHSSFSLNSGGGSVVVGGLPIGGYVPGNFYALSVTINHGTSDRKRWGFSLKVVDGSGNYVGAVNSTNANAKRQGTLNDTELSHFSAASTLAGANTYTYNNLSWNAPSPSVGPVTFYYVGNAGDNLSGSSGDYIYSGSTVVALPIDLKEFKATIDNNIVVLNWQTASEINSNYFDIERSDDGQFFFSIGKVMANGNSNQPVSYNFTDKKASNNNGSLIFYRLKLVDKDGSFKYSNHISVKPVISGITVKNLYPTIIRKNDQVSTEIISDKARTMDLSIFDETGRSLQNIKLSLVTGNNKIYFTPRVNNLKGMLFVKFSTNNFQQTKSLILQ